MTKTMTVFILAVLIFPIVSAQSGEGDDGQQSVNAVEIAGVTPDNALYGLDVFFDEVIVFLTPDALGKANARLGIMRERVAEMEVMAESNRIREMKAAESEGRKQMEMIGNLVRNVRTEDAPRLNESLQNHARELKNYRQRLMNIKESMLENETIDVSGDDIDESIENLFEMINTSENVIVHIGESWQDTFALQTAPRREIDWENMTDKEREAERRQSEERARIADEEQKEKFGFACQGGHGTGTGSNILTGETYAREWCCADSDRSVSAIDERHFYIKGALQYKVISIKEGEEGTVLESETFEDSCDGNTLAEWKCEGSEHWTSVTFECPDGCQDGACIDKQGILSGFKEFSEGEEGYLENCIDSDGGVDYSVKGTLATPEYNATDFCRDGSTVTEFSCGSTRVSDGKTVPVGRYYSCPDGCEDGACVQ